MPVDAASAFGTIPGVDAGFQLGAANALLLLVIEGTALLRRHRHHAALSRPLTASAKDTAVGSGATFANQESPP
ncbi:MAG TPA: hypothetical protein VM266_12230 [Solirubrobacteraceae bacterium]|nr:hypothetical protein [Solirubrobacteraceae bacterium]